MIQSSYTTHFETLPETGHPYEILARDRKFIDKYVDVFIDHINIVDAQFYYSNPLIFVLLDDVEENNTEGWGELWKDTYIIPHQEFDALENVPEIMAVNNVFLEKIGTLSEFMKDFDKHIEHVQKHALYYIAIKTPLED